MRGATHKSFEICGDWGKSVETQESVKGKNEGQKGLYQTKD